MINKNKEIEKYKALTLRSLKHKVKELKRDFLEEKQKSITYSRNFTLSLSNYCINNCGYCYYKYTIPKQKISKNVTLLAMKDAKKLIKEGVKYNCKEALIMSGEQPESFSEVKKELKWRGHQNYLEYVQKICKDLLKAKLLPHTNIGYLSFEEMRRLKAYNASMGLMLESTSDTLFGKGGVHEFSPGKRPEKRIEHIKNAGKLKIPFTSGLLLGIGESFDDCIRDLFLLKGLHEQYGHLQEIIIQNFEYKKGISYIPQKPLIMENMLKIVGVAKLIFQEELAIQVPPNLIRGYEEHFLKMGIDDLGGISPFTQDFINPEKEWPKITYLRTLLAKNGYVLKERFPIYKRFIKKKGFCPKNIQKIVNSYNHLI
ncbi:MAG: FO synthase subunit 1 [Promethearchaeota archaeon]|nr:MAG: FO synthase subunit 1 [Candidatus Lokiarchaeota archaeon]